MSRIITVSLLILALLLLGNYWKSGRLDLSSLTTTLQNLTKPSSKEPTAKDACIQIHGIWDEQRNICALPTADYGKECSDNNNCAGACLADLTPEEQNLLIQEPGKHTLEKTGHCSQWRPLFGCHPQLENGKINHLTCAD